MLKMFKTLSLPEYEDLMKERYEFANMISQKWQKSGIQALVTPTFPHCAFKDAHADEMGLMLQYNFIWNILHYPAGIVPITRVQKDEETFTDHHNDHWTHLLNETAKDSAGMPICVQVIAHSYEDEKALGVMEAISKVVKFKCNVPEIMI